MHDKFISAEPFPHLVIDESIPFEVAALAWDEFAAVPAEAWHTYSGHDEAGKRACRDWAAIERHAPTCAALLRLLTSPLTARLLSGLTGLEDLRHDETLYGGGMHAMPPGTSLGCHLDCERHPETGFTRRLNAILYLNELDHTCEHSERFGGRLQLWDRSRNNFVGIVPKAGRLVLMETGQHSYHSVERSIENIDSLERRSLASYFWVPPRARARFVATARDNHDAQLEAARLARSR